MRFVVVGAGAVGGVVGARLFESGHDVVLVARGDHGRAVAAQGLRVESPDGARVVRVPVVTDIGDLQLRGGSERGDVALLCVKSHHTVAALDALVAAAGPALPVVCLQNGVQNERAALRRFASVYGVPVMLPAVHLEPGVVQAYSTPTSGILDVGCYPAGVDDRARAVASVFAASTFDARALPAVMRFKYAKLLMNLANAVEALCGLETSGGELVARARREGGACLAAAGIDVATTEEFIGRRGELIRPRPIADQPRRGGSTWQSLQRATGSTEVDYLNGEIVLLGRLHGVPTPVNALLQAEATRAARERRPPGSVDAGALLARLGGG